LPRLLTHDGKRADIVAARRMQRRASVETNRRFARCERILSKSCVLRDVRHDQNLVGENVLITQRPTAFWFNEIQPVRGFEPLAIFTNKLDDGNRHVEQPRS